MELRIIWQIICRRKWIIIRTFVAIFLVVSIGSFLVRRFRPTYRAKARLFVSGSRAVEASLLEGIELKGLEGLTSTTSLTDNPMDTQIALITSWPIVDKVIKKLELKDKDGKWLRAQGLTKSRFLPTIFPVRRLTVKQYEKTDILEIMGESGNKKEAMEIANALASVYINERKKLSRDELVELYEFVSKEIDGVEKKYTGALAELMTFEEEEEAVGLDKEITTVIEKMAELDRQKESKVIDLYESRIKLRTAKAQLKKEAETMISAGVVSESPQIGILKKELADRETSLAGVLTELTDEHPDVIRLKRMIEKTKEELRQELKVHQEMAPELNTLEKRIAGIEAHLKEVDALIKKYSQRLLALPAKEYQLAQLQLSVGTARDIYSALLKYRDEITLVSALQFCNVRLVAPAKLPEKPAKPKILSCVVLGAFLGVMAGLGLGFLSEYIDDTIKDADDIKEYLKISLLGTIPLISKKTDILLSKKGKAYHAADAYRRVAHNIKMRLVDDGIKHLLVTSASPGEGKTIIAANLGITMAQNKKKILLVDADFAKPDISSLFNLSRKPGLSEIIVGKVTMNEAIQPTDVEGLSVLSSGEFAADPGQLAESERLRELISELGEKFDVIIYDTAPVLAVADTVVLASCLRNCILVLEAGKVSRKVIVHASEVLKNAKAEILGVVLNKCRRGKSSYCYHILSL